MRTCYSIGRFYLGKIQTADVTSQSEGEGGDQSIPPNRPRLRRGVGTVSFRNVDRLLSCFMTCITCPSGQTRKDRERTTTHKTNLFKFVFPILQIQMLPDLRVLTSKSDDLLPVEVIK